MLSMLALQSLQAGCEMRFTENYILWTLEQFLKNNRNTYARIKQLKTYVLEDAYEMDLRRMRIIITYLKKVLIDAE